MSLWLWLALGICGGALPGLAGQAPYRAWLARQSWRLSFWIAFVILILPFGIVLIMLLSSWDFAAIREMGALLVSPGFGWLSALTLGWLAGSDVMAFIHRQAPRLQGPPLSPEVMELAGDPEKVHQAIERYVQETKKNYAVATDMVELFASQHIPARQPWGPLELMYSGFAVAWYVALSIGYVLSLSSEVDRAHANYFVVGLAFFLFIPGLFGGFCGVCAGLVKSQAKADLRRALRDGRLTGRFAFIAGLTAGVVSIAGVLAAWVAAFSISNSEAGLWLAFAGVAGVLIASPYLGLWMIRRMERSPG